jgi:hypothetical protein
MPGKPTNTLFEWKWKAVLFKSTFQISNIQHLAEPEISAITYKYQVTDISVIT